MLTGSDARQDHDACAAADQYLVKPQALSGWRTLARCLGTIARHGGGNAAGEYKATAETETATGTQAKAEVGTASRIARQARECHLLHIDDDADDRELFALAFAKSGLDGVLHSVAGAADALLYLNQLGPHIGAPRPRLIILDLSLPRLDGRELLELLRVNPRFKSIPVIVLTGSENYADMARCRALGVDDYVVKPHTSQELVELIASFDHWLVGSETGSPLR
jgi:CheY-like chemotaxis protein